MVMVGAVAGSIPITALQEYYSTMGGFSTQSTSCMDWVLKRYQPYGHPGVLYEVKAAQNGQPSILIIGLKGILRNGPWLLCTADK